MTIEHIVDDFLKNEIGGIIITDIDDKIVYSDERLRLPEKVIQRFLHRAPLLKDNGERKLWELTDSDNNRYFRIITVCKEYDGKKYICHCLSDVSELADLSKNISEYSVRISDFSDFQTEILKVISKPYDSFLPALANLCGSDEAKIIMELRGTDKIAVTTYNGTISRTVAIPTEEQLKALDSKRSDRIGDYRCFISENVTERRFTVLLKENEGFRNEFFKDISVYNVIYLYIENDLLRDKIIYESEHDTLTDFYNLSKFAKMSEKGFGMPSKLAIYIAGVGDLEYMNDHYGNEAGDKLIKRAADSIRPKLDDNIKAYRIGGDKFAIIAADIDEDEAADIMRYWKETLNAANDRDDKLKCTLSCGMAYAKGFYETEKLLEQADVGMYREKRRLKEELIKKSAIN